MLIKQLCQKFTFSALKNFHKTRINSFFDATWTLMNHNHLNLTHIGRHLPGKSFVKNKIKRVDRLIGNQFIANDQLDIYKEMFRPIIDCLDVFVIAVDWSGYDGHDQHILRASLLFEGRSLPIYNKLFPQSELGSQSAHELFLDGLQYLLPKNKKIIIITDAGFITPWYVAVEERGWNFVGRGRMQTKLKDEESQEWTPLQKYADKSTNIPTYIASGIHGKRAAKSVEADLFSYDEVSKKRHGESKYPDVNNRHSKSSMQPWIIVTNLEGKHDIARYVINLYKKRMQIEQNFRDDKSVRFGFAWRLTKVRNKKRIEIYCLIAALATLLLWWIGYFGERQGWQKRFQANTRKDKRILSFITLGKQIITHIRSIKIDKFRDAAKHFILQYNNETTSYAL